MQSFYYCIESIKYNLLENFWNTHCPDIENEHFRVYRVDKVLEGPTLITVGLLLSGKQKVLNAWSEVLCHQ